jgi:hypothetical protein
MLRAERCRTISNFLAMPGNSTPLFCEQSHRSDQDIFVFQPGWYFDVDTEEYTETNRYGSFTRFATKVSIIASRNMGRSGSQLIISFAITDSRNLRSACNASFGDNRPVAIAEQAMDVLPSMLRGISSAGVVARVNGCNDGPLIKLENDLEKCRSLPAHVHLHPLGF